MFWAHSELFLLHSKNAHGEEKENLTAQALELSLKYHFVTPLTSMVVTKPEDNEDQTSIADKPGEGGHGERRPESRTPSLRLWALEFNRGTGWAGGTRPLEEGQVWEPLQGCGKSEGQQSVGCGSESLCLSREVSQESTPARPCQGRAFSYSTEGFS